MRFVESAEQWRRSRRGAHLLRILRLLWEQGTLGRNALGPLLGVTKVAISNLTAELIAAGVCEENGPSGKQGRKPVPLVLNKDAFHSIGIAFRGEIIDVALIDAQCGVVTTSNIPRFDQPWESIGPKVIQEIERLLQESHVLVDNMVGLGLTLPGILLPEEGIAVSSTSLWHEKNVNLFELFSRQLGLKCHMMNVSHLYALTEKRWGVAREMDNFLYLCEGFGLGMWLNGKLYQGQQSRAGEAGYMKVRDGGAVASDGRSGTLYGTATFYNIVDTIEHVMRQGGSTIAGSYIDPIRKRLLICGLAQAIKDGDRLCAQLMAETFDVIGEALINIAYLFNPQAIFLPTWTVDCPEVSVDVIKRKMGHYGAYDWGMRIEITSAKTGDDDLARGAALLPVDAVLAEPSLGQTARSGKS